MHQLPVLFTCSSLRIHAPTSQVRHEEDTLESHVAATKRNGGVTRPKGAHTQGGGTWNGNESVMYIGSLPSTLAPSTPATKSIEQAGQEGHQGKGTHSMALQQQQQQQQQQQGGSTSKRATTHTLSPCDSGELSSADAGTVGHQLVEELRGGEKVEEGEAAAHKFDPLSQARGLSGVEAYLPAPPVRRYRVGPSQARTAKDMQFVAKVGGECVCSCAPVRMCVCVCQLLL
jgi:hypothetical protein